MGTCSLLPEHRFARSHPKGWWLVPGIVMLLWFYSALLGITTPVLGAQKHGCAPDVPPPVPGNAIPAQPIPGNVLINEVLSQPKSNWNCSEPASTFTQENDSWIELYNPQTQPLNLYTAHTQISLNGGTTGILLPFGSTIAAHGLLVIFPQERQLTASPPAWNVVLSINSTIIDQVAAPLLQPDQSYARVPDGSTTWLYAGNPTIDASNDSIAQPVTPTPTRTPKITAITANTGGSIPVQAPSTGTQPTWKGVQLPSTPTPTLAPDITNTTNAPVSFFNQSQSSLPPQSSSSNGWLIALIVLLVLLLLIALLCYWRLFHAP